MGKTNKNDRKFMEIPLPGRQVMFPPCWGCAPWCCGSSESPPVASSQPQTFTVSRRLAASSLPFGA